MDEIMSLAATHDLKVIEDCAQAHGAKYKGHSVGAIGDIGCWSFCQDKIMTTGGEGGMVTTKSEALWKKMWSFKDHGKSYDAVYNKSHPAGFRWLHESFGSNYRMTEMQAAIGLIQLQKMASWCTQRRRHAEKIWQAASKHKALRVPQLPQHIEHAAYKAYVFVRSENLKSGWDRDRIMNEINARGIPCFSGSCSEVYLEKAFQSNLLGPVMSLPRARELGETSLMFLVHPTLTITEIEKTCETMSEILFLAEDRD
jgi:dTDP-4-amino-4,6-dideoxygalactose transaminase